MACFHPLAAWQLDDGRVVFSEKHKGRHIRRELVLPCGHCVGCHQVRVRAWAIRCMHEAQMYDASSFVTLTYDGERIDPSLRYSDFQLFMRYLRRSLGPTRFFMCGEYGSENFRPHFHALLFGRSFFPRKACGKDLYRSPVLERFWPHGFSSVGDVTYQSAAYVASYSLKKPVSRNSDDDVRYSRVDLRTGEVVRVRREFARMSLRPGIGMRWFEKYYRDVFAARDGVVKDGVVVPAPRYYMDQLFRLDPDLHFDKLLARQLRAGEFLDDNSVDRLVTRELCARAKLRFKERSL